MKIDSIKTNLRNIVLLAEEYKEEVPNSLDKEIKETEVAIKNGRDLNEYDKQFFNTIQQYKRNNFEQIIFFAERVFIELAAREKDGRYTRGFNSEFFIDKNKFNSLMKECIFLEEGFNKTSFLSHSGSLTFILSLNFSFSFTAIRAYNNIFI